MKTKSSPLRLAVVSLLAVTNLLSSSLDAEATSLSSAIQKAHQAFMARDSAQTEALISELMRQRIDLHVSFSVYADLALDLAEAKIGLQKHAEAAAVLLALPLEGRDLHLQSRRGLLLGTAYATMNYQEEAYKQLYQVNCYCPCRLWSFEERLLFITLHARYGI